MKESITSKQMVALITLTRLATALSIMPTVDLPPYNQDIWIMVLVSIAYTYIAMIPLIFLANKFRDETMIGYFQIIHGKLIGKILGVFYGLYFLANSVNAATIHSELITTSILPDSSENMIVIVMIITCIYCVSRGVMAGMRANSILSPITLAVVIILMLLGFSNFKYYLLLPILSDSSFLDINLGAIELSTFFSEIFFLTMLVPYLENKDEINKILLKSIIYSISILSIIVVVSYITFGVEYTQHSNFPFLVYARSIDIFAIVERIDAIAIVAWFFASSSRVSAFLAISVFSFREILNKYENEKIILAILGFILALVTLYIINIRSVVISRLGIYQLKNVLFTIFVLIIPLITSIVYFIRRGSIESKSS